jgi:hypothetical protein
MSFDDLITLIKPQTIAKKEYFTNLVKYLVTICLIIFFLAFFLVPSLNSSGSIDDKHGLFYQFFFSCLFTITVYLYYRIRYAPIVRYVEIYESSKKLHLDYRSLSDKLSVISALPLNKKLKELQILADNGLIHDIKRLHTENWAFVESAINKEINRLMLIAINIATINSAYWAGYPSKVEKMFITGNLKV